MRKDLFTNPRWIRIKEFYWIWENDIKDVKKMRQMWLKEDDINFITWKEEKAKDESSLNNIKTEAKGLWIKFNPRIWEAKLKEKIDSYKKENV